MNATTQTTDHTKDTGDTGIPDSMRRTAKPAAMTSTPPTAKAERVKQPTAAKPKAKRPAKPAVSAATDKPAPAKRSIVPASFKEKYAAHNDTCGSSLSMFLKEQTTGENKDGRECLLVDDLFAIAHANGIDTKKYKDLNNGQKRMNVYNRLVGLLNDGKDVKVGKRTFRAADHKPTTAKPKKVAAKAKPKAQPAPAQQAA